MPHCHEARPTPDLFPEKEDRAMQKLVYRIVRSALISSTPLDNGENTGEATLAEPPGETSLRRSLPDFSSLSSSRGSSPAG